MIDVTERILRSEALNYLQGVLSYGKTFSKYILENVRLEHGTIITFLPSDVTDQKQTSLQLAENFQPNLWRTCVSPKERGKFYMLHIMVTAVHSHMLTEEPRLFFMHFWANDNAVKLAKGLRAALDKTNSAQ